MANPKFLTSDITLYSLSADSAQSGYPLSNLNDYERDTIWKSDSDANKQCLVIDFGIAKTCNGLVVANHNLFSNDVEVLGVSAASTIAFTDSTAVGSYNLVDDADIYMPLTATSARFWRLQFVTDKGAKGKPQIGLVFLGELLEFQTPYDFGFKSEDKQYVTTESTALDGTLRMSQLFTGRKLFDFRFRLQNDATATGFRAACETVRGRRYPFWFIDTNDNLRYVHFVNDYNPVSVMRYGRNDITTVSLREHYVS